VDLGGDVVSVRSLVAILAVLVVTTCPRPAACWEYQPPASSFGPDSHGAAVAVDAERNIFAAGKLASVPYTPSGADYDMAVVKLAPNGAELWRHLSGGTVPSVYEGAEAVVLDAAGDPVVGGGLALGSTAIQTAPMVWKLSSADGSETWHSQLGSASGGFVIAVALDAAGDVIAGGGGGPTGNNAEVAKLSGSTGTPTWIREFTGSGGGSFVERVAVTPGGDVVAAGALGVPNPNTGVAHFLVAKFSGADGTELWRYTLDGVTVNRFNYASSLAVDAVGDVVAAGSVSNSGSDFTVVKLAGATGTEVWRTEINGTNGPTSGDQALAVGVDGAGDVIAGGSVENAVTSGDMFVIKLAGADGSERWRYLRTGAAVASDVVEALHVTPDDDVVAVGFTLNQPLFDPGLDPTIVRLDGATGSERWVRIFPRSEGFESVLVAVTVDAADHVVGVGDDGDSPARGMMVIKVDGSTGGDCGDEAATPGVEQCDDGGLVSGDGCSASCQLETRQASGAVGGSTLSVSTDPGTGATPSQPLQAGVAAPSGTTAGAVTITATGTTAPSQPGFATVGATVHIDAVGITPAPTAANPLVLTFLIDASLIPPGQDETTVQITKDGATVPNCGTATDPCVSERSRTADGDVTLLVRTSSASDWAFAADQLCAAAPQPVCRTPVLPAKSQLQFHVGKTPATNKAAWKWTKGAATSLAALGDPMTTTAYALCVYDAHAGDRSLAVRLGVPPGASWRAKGSKGFLYKDKAGVNGGVQAVSLVSGADGKVTASVKAKGASLDLALPLGATPNVVTQLRNSSGECWGATYTAPKKNTSTGFTAKSD
jgi:cysteine-rich repeat protein